MRRNRLVALLALLYAGLLAGVAALVTLSLDERADALAQLERAQSATHALARHDLLDRLDEALTGLEEDIERALADPLRSDAGMTLVQAGEVLLPRAKVFSESSRASEILDGHALGGAGADGDRDRPWLQTARERLELARAGELGGWLDHRLRYRLPLDVELPLTLIGLEHLAGAGLGPTEAEAILRRGVGRPEGRLEGYLVMLLTGRSRLTEAEFGALVGRAATLGRRLLVRVDDVVAAAYSGTAARDRARHIAMVDGVARDGRRVVLEPDDGRVNDGEARAWAIERRGERVVGRALDEEWLDALAGRLAAADQIDPDAEVTLGDDGVSVAITSPRWRDQAALADTRLMLKLLPLGLIAALGALVLVLAVVLQRRREAYIALRSNLLAAVSHELKTPLASMRAMAETLENRFGGDPRARDYPRRIVRSSERLAFLVDNVLSFARLDRGVWRPRPALVSISELFARIRDQAEAEALGEGARRIAVEAEVVPEELALEVDPELFALLLSNLVDNARRYGREGVVTVRLRARLAGDEVILEVSDDGPGLAVDAPERLFEDLGRGRLEGVRGTGLGLTICRQVMQLHGGRIALTSTSPHGTTFTLTFKAPHRRRRRSDEDGPRGEA